MASLIELGDASAAAVAFSPAAIRESLNASPHYRRLTRGCHNAFRKVLAMPAKAAGTTTVSIRAAYFDGSPIPSSSPLSSGDTCLPTNPGHHNRRRVLPGSWGVGLSKIFVNFIEALHPGCTGLFVPMLNTAPAGYLRAPWSRHRRKQLDRGYTC